MIYLKVCTQNMRVCWKVKFPKISISFAMSKHPNIFRKVKRKLGNDVPNWVNIFNRIFYYSSLFFIVGLRTSQHHLVSDIYKFVRKNLENWLLWRFFHFICKVKNNFSGIFIVPQMNTPSSHRKKIQFVSGIIEKINIKCFH